jgi:hypothetical protein
MRARHALIQAIPRPKPPAPRHASIPVALALSLAAPLLCACMVIGGKSQAAPGPGPVYGVETLRAYLAQHPAPAGGWRVRVRAQAEPCPAWGSPHSPLRCTKTAPVLVDPDGSDLADPLPLVVGSGSPLLAAVRTLPLAGGLVPATPVPPWEALHTYSVLIRTAPSGRCAGTPCVEAVLLDAAR